MLITCYKAHQLRELAVSPILSCGRRNCMHNSAIFQLNDDWHPLQCWFGVPSNDQSRAAVEWRDALRAVWGWACSNGHTYVIQSAECTHVALHVPCKCPGALTLYQPMMSWSPHKPIGIDMGNLILGVILLYMVSASFSCFLWSVKG